MRDKAIEKLIREEKKRQFGAINLIASENYVSKDVLEALGSVFVNKYAEGYPGARYYGGNDVADRLENLVRERALKLFGLKGRNWSVNVQAYSGSPANLAIYQALVPLGGKIMGLRLDMGGHLTHGHKASALSKIWRFAPYFLDKKTERLDYRSIEKIALKEKPKLIIAGYSAYSRIIDFAKFRSIARKTGAILMVDMSHFAGLVAGRVYPSPFPYADVVMTTTHKTLRGPRAGLIFSKSDLSSAVDRSIFPGFQGGPHLNQIAAIGVALFEAQKLSFRSYARQVVKNARALAGELDRLGWRIVSGGTDSHLFLVDVASRGLGGETASRKLEREGIIVNKNTIPYDSRKPSDPSGIRVGTSAITSRGLKESDMKRLARRIDKILLS